VFLQLLTRLGGTAVKTLPLWGDHRAPAPCCRDPGVTMINPTIWSQNLPAYLINASDCRRLQHLGKGDTKGFPLASQPLNQTTTAIHKRRVPAVRWRASRYWRTFKCPFRAPKLLRVIAALSQRSRLQQLHVR